MKIGTAFPSKYLKASDLPHGTMVKVQIERVSVEEISSKNAKPEHKPILFFSGKEKGLVLNKTNANTISRAYGDETDDWRGRMILLYSTDVEFGGEMVEAVRVKIPVLNPAQRAGAAVAAARPAPASVEEQPAPPFVDADGGEPAFAEDDIPF